MKIITRKIIILSLVSLFTDIASEMLYPVMPIYLTSIGFSVVLIGVLEGFAEAVAGLSKGYFGKLSDVLRKRKPFVLYGYSISAFSKPMMGVAAFPAWIFIARTLDRLGKGIRTGARDAMLSAETTPEFKGRVFGFHRMFDTFGAALGPSAALLFLFFYPMQYKILFFLAVIPGVCAVTMVFLVKENVRRPLQALQSKKKPGFFYFLKYWKTAPRNFRILVAGLLFFTLANSSDVLLLLMMHHQGAADHQVIGIYIFYNLIFALMSYPMGMLGDKIGLKYTFITGLILFSVVYSGIAFVTSVLGMTVLFIIYGIYAASTEGISKAWISNIVPENEVATAIGFYTGIQSICAFIASSLTGWLWYTFSPETAFISSAAGAIITAVYLAVVFGLRRK